MEDPKNIISLDTAIPLEILINEIFCKYYIPYEAVVSKRFYQLSLIARGQRIKQIENQYPNWKSNPIPVLKEVIKTDRLDQIKFMIYHCDNDYIDYNLLAVYAVIVKSIDILNWLISKGADNYDRMALNAAHSGHQELMEELINKSINSVGNFSYQDMVRCAIEGCREKIMQYLMEKYHSKYYPEWTPQEDIFYDKLAAAAAYSNNKELMEHFINKYHANDYNTMACRACIKNNKELVIYIITKYDASHFNKMAAFAALGGNLELIIYLMTNYSITQYSFIAIKAAYKNHLNIIEYLHTIYNKYTLTDYNRMAGAAAYGNHKNLMEHIIKKYHADDYNRMAINAAEGDNLQLLIYILDKYKNECIFNYHKMSLGAARWDCLSIIQYLIKHHGITNFYSMKKMASKYHNIYLVKWLERNNK